MNLPDSETVHASCISVDGSGLLILGASGAGKSTLSLQLLGIGAELVADDRTMLFLRDQKVFAQPPPSIKGLIEMRGLGLLSVPCLAITNIVAVVDLDRCEDLRFPVVKTIEILGIQLPCLFKVNSPAFPSALLHYLRYGRDEKR